MGGKIKQSQRTKNNVRPSSSGRSALLLSNVKFESGVGFGGSELAPVFSSVVVPTIDPAVSPELQICIKKLNKKDPITKTKALQELTELVSTGNIEDVVSILPSWAHFYKLLSADSDRKVRETTQLCHGRIMSTCGRRAAPALRTLMGSWLQAQHDDHAPAAAAAAAALAKTFPDNKLPEVLAFCKEEVMTHLIDNITGTGEAAYIKKTDSEEEAAATSARVVASSLHAVQLVCARLHAAHTDWLWARLAPLLQSKALWNKARHQDDAVRAAWYAAMGGLRGRFGAEFAAVWGQRMLRVMLAARESAPFVAAHYWDALLLFIYNIQDWPKYLDNTDLLSKRIIELLENGGWGEARRLGHLLLPLLAHLPPEVRTQDFLHNFFEAMFLGLETKSIMSSKSERQSWVASIAECVRYLSTLQQPHVAETLSAATRRWLRAALAAQAAARHHLLRCCGQHMADTVCYWLRQAHTCPRYDQFIRAFWQNVCSTLTGQIDKLSTEHAEIAATVEAHTLLLHTLRTSFNRTPRRQLSIKFTDDAAVEAPSTPSEEFVPVDASVVDRYEHNLNDVVHTVCAHYFHFANKCELSEPVLSPLMTLLKDFDSAALFQRVSERFGCDSIYSWYEGVLRLWLCGDTMRGRSLVDVVFLLLRHLSEEQQDAVFDSFSQCPYVVEWCMCASMSHPHCSSRSARRWLRAGLVSQQLRVLAARLLQRGDGASKALLLQCLNTDRHGELAISAEAAAGVVSQLCAGVRAASTQRDAGAAREHAGAAHEAVAAVCVAACAATPDPAARDQLARALFTLSMPFPWSTLSPDTREECRAAWQDALVTFDSDKRGQFVQYAAESIHEHLALQSEALVPAHDIEPVVSLCPYLVCDPEQLSDVPHLTSTMFSLLPPLPAAVEPCALLHDVITGRLSCPLASTVAALLAGPTLLKRDLISYVNSVVFKAVYTDVLLSHSPEGGTPWCDVMLQPAAATRAVCGLLHHYMVLRSLHEGYAFWPHYKLIEEAKTTTEELVTSIIRQCSSDTRQRIKGALTRLATDHGLYWAYATKYFDTVATDTKCQHDQEYNNDDTEQTDDINESDNKLVESDESDIKQNESNQKDNSCEIKESSPIESKLIENSLSESKESESSQIQSKENGSLGDSKEPSNADYVDDFNVERINDIVATDGYFHMLQATVRDAAESECLRARYITMLRAFYLAHRHDAQATGARFVADACRGQVQCDADVIVNAYYAANHVMLYEMDISASPWSAVCSNTAIVQYLTSLVAARGWSLAQHHWDFVNITLCSLLASLHKSRDHWGKTEVSSLCVSVLRLHGAVQEFVRGVRARCEREQPSAHVASLPHEWDDVFGPDADYNVLSLAVYVLETGVSPDISYGQMGVMHELLASLPRVQWHRLAGARRRELAPARVQPAVCAALAARGHLAHKYLAGAVAAALLEPHVLEDAELVSGVAAEAARPRLWLARYKDTWDLLQARVLAALDHVKVCESSLSPELHSEVFDSCLGWLLMARALHEHESLARGDLAYHLVQLHRELGYTEPLLSAALRLLPAPVLAWAAAGGSAPPPPAHKYFDEEPPLDLYAAAHEAVQWLSCGAVRRCVRGCGAGGTRGWRAAQPHKVARALDAIVATYISPRAIKDELGTLQRRAGEVDDLEVAVQWGARAADCVLRLEERALGLLVRLAPLHPLQPPRLEAAPGTPAAHTHWLHLYVTHQRGSVLNALKLWAASLARRVERAPPCYICYCRLHYASAALPAAHCRQCRNTFHTACLNKWFKSSGKSNCPICRGPF